MMASGLSKQLAAIAAQGNYHTRGSLAAEYDNELQEIRVVLFLTADRYYPEHGHCWCRKDLTDDAEPHNEFCQRARQLADRLRVG